MELPHLTLFLRRLSAPPPSGAGLRETLRTPRVKYILTWALWSGIALSALIDPDALDPGFSSRGGWGWFYDLNDVFTAVVALGGNFWAYLTIASAANDLAADRGSARWPQLAQPTLPAWFSTLITSRHALLSAGLIALIGSAPALCGMLAGLALAQSGHVYTGYGANPADELFDFWWMNITALLRLPQFFLGCCCMSLALRSSPLRTLLPASLALLATATALIVPLYDASDYISLSSRPTPGINPGLLYAAALLAVLLYCFALGCIRLAGNREGAGAAGFGLVLLLSLGILVLGILGAGPEAYSGWLPVILSSVHGFYATLFPDVQVFHSAGPSGFRVYDLFMRPATGAAQAALAWMVTLAFWYWAALRCLNAARGSSGETKPPALPV